MKRLVGFRNVELCRSRLRLDLHVQVWSRSSGFGCVTLKICGVLVIGSAVVLWFVDLRDESMFTDKPTSGRRWQLLAYTPNGRGGALA